MGRHKQKGGTPREAYLSRLASIYRLTCWLNNYAQRKRYTYKQRTSLGMAGVRTLLWSIVHRATTKLVHIQARILTKQK